MEITLGNEETDFIGRAADAVPANTLSPKMWVYFERITLVSKTIRERVTFGIGLKYLETGGQGKPVMLPAIVVAEIKQDQFISTSKIIRLMKREGIARAAFSKYCIGTALLKVSYRQEPRK